MIKIRCPHCKKWVSIKTKPVSEDISSPCPFCKAVSPFGDWENEEDIQRIEKEKKEAAEQRKRELAAQRERELAAQRERELAAQRERELAAQRERELAAQRERELAAQRERELAAQRERELAAQRERELAAQRERELAAQRERELEEKRRREEERKKKETGAIGSLVSLSTGTAYNLFPGRILVGRKASSSSADIQIPDITGMQRMSRVHLVINVLKENGKYVHYVSLNSPKVNTTYLNNMPLMYGQQLLLNPGDVINMPDEILRFEISEKNEDETELGYY